MKKKILSCFLAVVMIMSCFSCAFSVFASESSHPILYITGQGTKIYDKDGNIAYDSKRVPIPDGLIDEMVKEVVPLFVKAIVLGTWDEYRERFLSYWVPIYEKIALDKNGEISNGSYLAYNWMHYSEKPNYTFGSYHYVPDWRLDPMYEADRINTAITEIKEMTGADKVDVISRCEGCNMFMAYLAKYGYDDINHAIFHASSVNGIDMMGTLFSGDFVFDPAKLSEWYYSGVSIDDPAVSALLNATVSYLVDSYGFEKACSFLEKIAPELYEKIGYDLILTSYGSFPGMWAVVGPDYYKKARKNAFKGREEEYAGLIEKIDTYDKEVRQKTNDILLHAAKSGVKVSVVAKYGDFSYKVPLCKEMYEHNDDAICLRNSTFGATDAKCGNTFSDKYLAAADMKYISPDKCIDCSTCLFPERTWILYGANHNNFDSISDQILLALLRADGEMTVDSNPAFPQYLKYTSSGIIPFTESDVPAPEEQDSMPRLMKLLIKFLNFIRELFSFLGNRTK